VIGFGAPVLAGPTVVCDTELTLEINALRGGSGHVLSGGTKDITAKARIVKGSSLPDTTVNDTLLTVTSYVGLLPTQSRTSTSPFTLEVGKGGKGDKIRMDVPACAAGQTIDYVAKFVGTASTNGATCEIESGRLSKTCK
jgi:hypothetical protein